MGARPYEYNVQENHREDGDDRWSLLRWNCVGQGQEVATYRTHAAAEHAAAALRWAEEMDRAQ